MIRFAKHGTYLVERAELLASVLVFGFWRARSIFAMTGFTVICGTVLTIDDWMLKTSQLRRVLERKN